jgi:hypothetical protein
MFCTEELLGLEFENDGIKILLLVLTPTMTGVRKSHLLLAFA